MRSYHKKIFIIVFSTFALSCGFVLPYGNSFLSTPLVHAQFDPIFIGGDAGFSPPVFIGGDAGVITPVFIGGDAGTPVVPPVADTPIFIGGDAGGATPIFIGGDAGGVTPIFIGGDAGAITPIFIGGDAGTPVITPIVDTPFIPFSPIIPFVPPPLTVALTTASVIITPIFGCMDSTATNYNSAATSQTGVICTYPVVPPVPATIRVNKIVINDDGGTKVIADFPLLVDTTAVVSGVVNTFIPGTYTVTEINQPGYAATFSGDCSATGTITITAGQNKVCTITNNDIAVPPVPATIKVTKVVINDDGGTKVIADFPLFVSTATATTSVVSGAVNIFSPDTYTVTEINQPGYDASFSGDCDATGHITITAGQSKVCTITNNDIAVVVTPPPSGGGGGGGGSGGGGGGGGGSSQPNITLFALPHVGLQPLAYLYLSQIPRTGLTLTPDEMILYWVALIGFALALAYAVLFGVAPVVNRSIRNFGMRVLSAVNTREAMHVVLAPVALSVPEYTREEPQEVPRDYSSYDGFKSYAKNGALSIEDIVKSLSQHHTEPIYDKVEPVYEHTEPIYENVEPIEATIAVTPETIPEPDATPASVRGFASALLEGDRTAVFAGLRQQVRGGGKPEQLISAVACLVDDVYRSRIDGTACDADIARLSARLSTPVLEKLITALTTAIDSSYSEGVTGAKLALTRALATLGA